MSFAQQQRPTDSIYRNWPGWQNARNGLPPITTLNGLQVDRTAAYFIVSPVSYKQDNTPVYPFVSEYVLTGRTLPGILVIEDGYITPVAPILTTGPGDATTWESMFNTKFSTIEVTSRSELTTSLWYTQPQPIGEVQRTVKMVNGRVAGVEYRLYL